MTRKRVRRGSSSMNKTEFGPVHNEATLGREIQTKIGEQLRALYDDVVGQGVPDRFVELLQRLDKKDDGEPR
jgi:Anti-sigma factor NepR